MREIGREGVRLACLTALLLLIVGARAGRAGDTDTALCWSDAYDADGDGYAAYRTNRNLRVEVAGDPGVDCPDGYVAKRGDLDDNDASVHPRQPEVYGNGKDDNGNGRVDEPEIKYYPSGNANTASSFKMYVQVNDPAVVDVWNARGPKYGLYYEVTWQYLTDTSEAATHRSGRIRVTSFNAYPLGANTTIQLGGLPTGQVLRARVQFYSGVAMFPKWLYTLKGHPSDWYYTVTDGSGNLAHARTRVLMNSFYHYYASTYLGLFGYRGRTYEDGTYYGADLGDAWCSEHFSYHWRSELRDLPDDISYWQQLIDYFDGYGAWSSDLDDAKRGDYLAVYDGDGNISHSTMFLAYDAATGLYWALSGNGTNVVDWSGTPYEDDMDAGYAWLGGGNEVSIDQLEPDAIAGTGAIVTSMLP